MTGERRPEKRGVFAGFGGAEGDFSGKFPKISKSASPTQCNSYGVVSVKAFYKGLARQFRTRRPNICKSQIYRRKTCPHMGTERLYHFVRPVTMDWKPVDDLLLSTIDSAGCLSL